MPRDAILLEVYRHRFAGVAEEMGITLQRTGYSPNIKERLDFSCAVFDARGRMIAQAAHIPVHLGAMPASCAAALSSVRKWSQGDVVIVNDPFDGGNHLPDITMVSPVFAGKLPVFFVASRAHHADVGGMTPGSLPLSTELYQEGIIIPPVRLYRDGMLCEDLLELILRNVRTPDERRGDLAAQRAAHAIGERRLLACMQTHGTDEVLAYADHLCRYSEQLTRAEIFQWPDGVFKFTDAMELPDGEDALIRVAARIAGSSIMFDFAGTDPVVHAPLNTVHAVTASACYYAVRCLMREDIPVNAGCFAPVTVRAPANCLINARRPAAVAGGNVETSQRITDAVLGALAQAVPDRVGAAGQGTMNNLTIGGTLDDGCPFAYYETIGGGMGAAPGADGLSGVHVHMSNTLNTPIEALELQFPFRITRYALIDNSGGAGRFQGGRGIVREYAMLDSVTVTMLSERRRYAPWGLAGGAPGRKGRNMLIDALGKETELPGKFTRHLQTGDRLRIETPGGGGYADRNSRST
ncbi:MAG: hydantoinase B/oxoprolinase family protein [Bacteroidota bacterium]|nr:hydantoinase B/oxoprolinase family protein [Bacteroidota bacterium]